MAKIRDPVLFSEHFKVDLDLLRAKGALDPFLNSDTELFIDPLLLRHSAHPEMQKGHGLYEERFGQVLRLLKSSQREGDLPWRNAERLLKFPEVRATCLGYGQQSIAGSAFGDQLRGTMIRTAHEIIQLGVTDPDLFPSLALLEDNIGPDRISDMTANIIFWELARFTVRVLSGTNYTAIRFAHQNEFFDLPRNPFEKKPTPVLLCPTDVLRQLPIAASRGAVNDAAEETSQIKARVNQHIGNIWQKDAQKKPAFREMVVNTPASAGIFMEIVHSVPTTPYDLTADPAGLLSWWRTGRTYARNNPISLPRGSRSVQDVQDIVRQIVEQFKHLVENSALVKELWDQDGKPRKEKTAQRFFYSIADTYCKLSNLDLTAEAETGNGPVDFKFASTYNARVLVEIKLSRNGKLIQGYSKQLEAYKAGQQTGAAFYVVLDLGDLGERESDLIAIRNEASAGSKAASELVFIDATPRLSASKLD